MINLTTEIRSRRFTGYEKNRLYGRLRNPFLEKRDEWRDNFIDFLDKNVLKLVLDPDLIELGKKPYCSIPKGCFRIDPSSFGLDDYYVGKSEFKTCRTSLSFEFYSKTIKYALNKSIYSLDISSLIINKCTPEIIDQIKYFLYECAKSEYECSYFGLGTIIKPRYYGNSFPEINTWGNLYNKNPKYFEILYNLINGEYSKDLLNPEEKLLAELKTTLGY